MQVCQVNAEDIWCMQVLAQHMPADLASPAAVSVVSGLGVVA